MILDFTKQIHQMVINTLPAYTDEFSLKLPIASAEYDTVSQTVTATLSNPSDIAYFQDGEAYTITDMKTLVNIVSASWYNYVYLEVLLDQNVGTTIGSKINLQGFVPSAYNIEWTVFDIIAPNHFILSYPYDQNTALDAHPAVTQTGYFFIYVIGSGYNGAYPITITDPDNGIFTYQVPYTVNTLLQPSVYTLSGGAGEGVGFLHNTKNTIIVGEPANGYPDDNQTTLWISNNVVVETNQEKQVDMDTSAKVDDIIQYSIRNIYTVPLIYFIRTTYTALQSQVFDLQNSMSYWVQASLGGRILKMPNNASTSAIAITNSPSKNIENDQGVIYRACSFEAKFVIEFTKLNLNQTSFYNAYPIDSGAINIQPINNTFTNTDLQE